MDGSTITPVSSIDSQAMLPSTSFMALILGLRPMLERYETLRPTDSPWDFANLALRTLGVFSINEGELLENTLPKSGPLIVYANHPFGGIEGLIMAAKCGILRPDFKLLANRMLFHIPELRPMIIPINVAANSQKENLSAVRAALRHVEAGGAIGLFPSGVVSHWNIKKMSILEPEWYSLCGRLARIPNVNVVPMFFKGTNSAFFHIAGCMHPMLRTFLLPRELWRMRGRTVRYIVGKTIDKKLLASFADDKGRTAHMRIRCEQLNTKNNALPKIWHTPIDKAYNASTLNAEVEKFTQVPLVTDGNYVIFSIKGNQSKAILHEICRLREKTFRLVGEGSGKGRDIDHFDINYTHLVLWDKLKNCLVGAYRVRCFEQAQAQEIIPNLYTWSLFAYKTEFFDHCKKSMELGRAFVTPEYQRDYEPLMLLWKGIGRLIYQEKIRTLFGPCSIGLGYAPASAYILRQYLIKNHWHDILASLVQGRRAPANITGPNMPDVQGLDYNACNRAVKDIEGDKGLPILFKHYLQLGGRIAAFHEDRSFGTLDALLVVDIAKTPEKILLRYLNPEELQKLYASYDI